MYIYLLVRDTYSGFFKAFLNNHYNTAAYIRFIMRVTEEPDLIYYSAWAEVLRSLEFTIFYSFFRPDLIANTV